VINLYNLQDVAAARRARFEELAERNCLLCACAPERQPIWCRLVRALGALFLFLGRQIIEGADKRARRGLAMTSIVQGAGQGADEIDSVLGAGPHRIASHGPRL